MATAAACGDSPLAPVQTADGTWQGVQSGFALTLIMAQTDTTISGCTAFIGSNGGQARGTCTGSFVYPNLKLKVSIESFVPFDYQATMSSNEAKMFGHMNGSGLNNLEMDIKKQ